jgi:hypothetical protein
MADVDEFIKLKPVVSMTLTITVGSGKIGSVAVSLDGAVLPTGAGNPVTVPINGTIDDLKGKVLRCTTTVAEIPGVPAGTSVTYELAGADLPFKKTVTKPSSGGIAFHTAFFNLYA